MGDPINEYTVQITPMELFNRFNQWKTTNNICYDTNNIKFGVLTNKISKNIQSDKHNKKKSFNITALMKEFNIEKFENSECLL